MRDSAWPWCASETSILVFDTGQVTDSLAFLRVSTCLAQTELREGPSPASTLHCSTSRDDTLDVSRKMLARQAQGRGNWGCAGTQARRKHQGGHTSLSLPASILCWEEVLTKRQLKEEKSWFGLRFQVTVYHLKEVKTGPKETIHITCVVKSDKYILACLLPDGFLLSSTVQHLLPRCRLQWAESLYINCQVACPPAMPRGQPDVDSSSLGLFSRLLEVVLTVKTNQYTLYHIGLTSGHHCI